MGFWAKTDTSDWQAESDRLQSTYEAVVDSVGTNHRLARVLIEEIDRHHSDKKAAPVEYWNG